MSRRPLKPKAFFTKQFYLWHWVSSAICLAAMLFFAFTGITLNHAADLKATAKVEEKTATLPPELLANLAPKEGEEDAKAPLPADVVGWLRENMGIRIRKPLAEWSADEIYLGLPRPGGDAWLSIDRATGEVVHETSRQGAIAYLNDLHKGRNTGTQWSWFIDIFSVACVVFSLTGLGLLWVHCKRRLSTWPVVAAGVLLPVLIVIFFVH